VPVIVNHFCGRTCKASHPVTSLFAVNN
jgi:hypothetical protein